MDAKHISRDAYYSSNLETLGDSGFYSVITAPLAIWMVFVSQGKLAKFLACILFWNFCWPDLVCLPFESNDALP